MSASNAKFVVNPGWQILVRDLGVSPPDLLRHARVPPDLFSRPGQSLNAEAHFRIWNSLEQLVDDPLFPLKVVQVMTVETFSPPVFACFCSANLNAAFRRLAQYKPLIGPMRLNVDQRDSGTTVSLGDVFEDLEVPRSLIAMELAFFVQIGRQATREPVTPQSVHVTTPLSDAKSFEDFFGVAVTQDAFNGVTFRPEDAEKPFLTANENIWSVFEPELRMRLNDLQPDARFRDRVRACLTETLAGGSCSMELVAKNLAVSTRTLQRRLSEEGTSFQQQLNSLREELARHYLTNSSYSSAEISFLLGYDEPSSFFRAFHAWTGTTPDTVRQSGADAGLH